MKVVCFLLRSLLIYPRTKPLTFSCMSVFQRLASLDGTLKRMLLSREDKDLSRLSSITGRWTKISADYMNICCLVRYVNWLREILASMRSSDAVKRDRRKFIESVNAMLETGGICPSLTTMVDTIEYNWDGLFICFYDPRIPRTDNNLDITIRHEKLGYRKMS